MCPVSAVIATRRRRQTFVVHQIGTHLGVELNGAALLKRSFASDAQGTLATFDLRCVDPPFYYYSEHIEATADLLERVSPADVFEAVGHVEPMVSQGRISGTLNGTLAVVANRPFRQLDGYCRADHSSVTVRQ